MNVSLKDGLNIDQTKFEKALMIWCNSTFGILAYWYVSGSQQSGRGRMNNVRFRQLAVPDFAGLDVEQLEALELLFDYTCGEKMLPINQLDEDAVRKCLDAGIINILGPILSLDVDQVRQMIAAEPHFEVPQGRADLVNS